MRKLLVLVFISCFVAITSTLPALADFGQQRQLAGRYYEAGDFRNAHKAYKELARKGDSFSQYRLSYMYLMGEGQAENVIESVAWSVLAAQDKHQEKIAYMKTVAEIVPADQRKKANKKISYYVRKWGNESESRSSRGDQECTGSRLCNHKTNPGNVGVPINLWNVSNDFTEQELKTRATDINASILKTEAGSQSNPTANEA